MKKVFTRWPSQIRPTTHGEREGRPAAVPGWLSTRPERSRRQLPRDIPASAVVLLLIALLLAAVLTCRAGPYVLTTMLAVAAGLALTIACAVISSLRRSLIESDARYGAVFERAGISMWREDWSAAAREVSALLDRGVTDMEGYFATRPEELRRLCAEVMIKDVNAFTVEEAGAPGKEAFVGRLDRLLPHTDQTFVQWLVAFARGDRFFRSEAHITLPDGSTRDTLFTAALPNDVESFSDIIVTSLDITGYKREQAMLHAAETSLARAARISTVGALSASIAHEVNSPLAAVLANAQAALRWLRRPAPNVVDATEAVTAIIADATRAKDVVARTRAFVGNAPVSNVALDVVAAARDAILLVERELRELGAAVHLRSEPDLPAPKGDVVQIQQVFTNLLLNAAQAMDGQVATKEIIISFRAGEKDVRVDISDSGHGIDTGQLEQIFEPFYTTKTQGMGMGLAICRNSVDAQGGNIWATSGSGRGVTIHFTLPVQRD